MNSNQTTDSMQGYIPFKTDYIPMASKETCREHLHAEEISLQRKWSGCTHQAFLSAPVQRCWHGRLLGCTTEGWL